jgi:hypothetical protein
MSNLTRVISTFCVFLALTLPFRAFAESRSDVYNGGTCVAYPGVDRTTVISNAIPYSFFIYGFRGLAFCHFSIPSDWNVNELSYVLFTGLANSGSGPMGFRLCVYGPLSFGVTCGGESTIPDNGAVSVNWVAPPAVMPSDAFGAYLSVRFPNDNVSTVHYFIPVWSR